MTRNELTAAAERLRLDRDCQIDDFFAWPEGSPYCDRTDDVTRDEDLMTVRDAYLAALPLIEQAEREADETPIDEEWLESACGFYGDGDEILHRWITANFRVYRLHSFECRVMYTGGNVHFKTRGQVRKLFAGPFRASRASVGIVGFPVLCGPVSSTGAVALHTRHKRNSCGIRTLRHSAGPGSVTPLRCATCTP